MGFAETITFYLLIGGGVAIAVYISDARRSRLSPSFRTATALVFWPLYVPGSCWPDRGPSRAGNSEAARQSEGDATLQAIDQVEAELEAALANLDGWIEDVLAPETERLRILEFRLASRGPTDSRDGSVAHPGRDGGPGPDARPAPGREMSDRCRRSEQARHSNLARLRQGSRPGRRRPHGASWPGYVNWCQWSIWPNIQTHLHCGLTSWSPQIAG